MGFGEDVGLTRRAKRARRLRASRGPARRSSSASDSTLKRRMLARRAASISRICLPVPEKTTRLRAGLLALATRASSPPETMSKPAPCSARRRRMAREELALTA